METLTPSDRKIMNTFMTLHKNTIQKLKLTNQKLINMLENSRGPSRSWSLERSLHMMEQELKKMEKTLKKKMIRNSMPPGLG